MTVPAKAAAHLFVDDLDVPTIGDGDRHHVERVLRLRAGEVVTVSDGRGGLRACTFVAGGGLEPAADVEQAPARTPSVGVGFALVKGDRPEWIVQKLTECGVDRIIPFAAARSIVRWDEAKAAKNRQRLLVVAREAAMQSRQRWLPTVEPLRPFDEVVRAAGGVARTDMGGATPTLATPTLLVGPEGGWSDEERAALPDPVSLGPAVLRAETAAVAAAVLLTALRSGVVSEGNGRVPRS